MREVELIGFGYIVFDNTVLFLLAFWELITFESLSLWVSVVFGVSFGFILSILFFKPWKDSAVNICVSIVFAMFLLIFTGEHGTSSYIKHYKELIAKEDRRYIEVEKWRKNNPNDFLRDTEEGREWLKADKSIAKEVSQYKKVIENKLSNQFLFLFFSIVTFVFFIPQIRTFIYNASRKAEQLKQEREREVVHTEKERKKQVDAEKKESSKLIESITSEHQNSSREIDDLIDRARKARGE